jgi:putative oxidoreductase
MAVTTTLALAVRRGVALAATLSFVAPLATRLVIGLAFIHTGLGKWQHFGRTTEFFASLGIPFAPASAALVATLETAGGAALIVGLLTRLSALGLSAVMAAALLTADRQAFIASWSSASEVSPTDVTAFVFLLFLLWLTLLGPGRASLDHLLQRFLVPGVGHTGAPAIQRGC